MTDEPRDTPEDRLVDGLLGLLRTGESERMATRVRSALDEVASLEKSQRNRMRIWTSLTAALGMAAAIGVMVMIFISIEPASQNAIAEIDLTLEKMTGADNRWYRIEVGRAAHDEAPGRGFKGLACTSSDGRFVSFMHHLGDKERREVIVGNDGENYWSIRNQRRALPDHLFRMLNEGLQTTVTSGSVNPARILRLVRNGWNLDLVTREREGRRVLRVEATVPAPSRGRKVIDHITLEIDPDSHALEMLEVTRIRDGVEDEKAYLLLRNTDESREFAGFTERDYLRTDRPRDPDPNS